MMISLRSVWIVLLALTIMPNVIAPAGAQEFVHPGLLQSRADLDRMRLMVAKGVEPWKSGFDALGRSPQSQLSYVPRGYFAEVGRNPSVHNVDFDMDANASYQCAIMWSITGNQAYADKSRQIIVGWADALTTVSGTDAVLMAGLGPFKMVNAAEILRYTDPKWSASDSLQCESMFKSAIYPVLKGFALFANGNWDTAAVKTVMAIGVFCNDRAIYESALRYYVAGAGDGRLTHYVYEDGQCQESGRDQAHTQLGLGHLGDCCEIAWNQGLDLYGFADNRLLKGFEYTAQYNLGNNVPFTPDLDRTGKYAHDVISAQGRGTFRPIFEQIYNHYVNCMGLAAPFTQQVAAQIRPEGAAQDSDHPGYGTLLYSIPPSVPPRQRSSIRPVAPGAVIARGSDAAIVLSWIAPVGAVGYSVRRAEAGGRIVVLSQSIKAALYSDKNVHSGVQYTYSVSARGVDGSFGPQSTPVTACAGLPPGWRHQDIGAVTVPGSATCDGKEFTLEGAGSEIGGQADQFHYVYKELSGDGIVTARFVPQVSCQTSCFGLMLRSGLAADAADVSLLLVPVPAKSVEAPTWTPVLAARSSQGAGTNVIATGQPLAAPIVTYGRLMQPFWLRLARAGNSLAAFCSTDGFAWTQIGSATVPLGKPLQAGLAACSNRPQITTTASFDSVTVSNH
jgi:hypothetical protein